MIDGIPTYCINLDRRPDRMAHFSLQARALGFDYIRFDAVDGRDYPEHPADWRGKTVMTQGQRGCYESHRALLSELDRTALVFEDDAVLAADIKSELTACISELPDDWDLLYLGGFSPKPLARYSRRLLAAESVFTTHAYLVRDKFIPTLLEHVNDRVWKVDVLFAEAQACGRCFLADPVLAWQRAGHSDVEGRVTNNKHLHPV